MKKAQAANFPQFEEEMLKTWQQENTFEQSLANRKNSELFNFYDGPPFANGLPHYGHVVPVTVKDAVTRYKTMRGYYVPRRLGWDTHGLPVETEIEKQLGLKGKREILELGIDKFVEACRASVFKYKQDWEDFFDRIGRWADKENAFSTMDTAYMESVWWAIKELHSKDLLYEGFRSMPYCPRCATPLSNFEVNQNYKDDTPDPSVYVKFVINDERNERPASFLAWTTTPWTLPANAALAVDPQAEYVTIEMQTDSDAWAQGEWLVLAKSRLSELDARQAEYKVASTYKGSEIVGWRYQPLYELAEVEPEAAAKAWQVYADESVSLEDGTGILHMAPRYGETDLDLGLREGLPLIESVDGFGRMTDKMGPFAGKWFKDADKEIIEELAQRGRLFAAETFKHTYPFCWRCDTPLMYFAISTWNVRVAQLAQDMVKTNQQINWIPKHIKEGRFGNWLAEARDWGISRNRFWGNPLPIWRNDADPEDIIVISSLAELKELSVDGKVPTDLHRPAIDAVKLKKDGQTYSRVEEVLDCWFESGSMPFAQAHYPLQSQEQQFTADFIAEGVDQTRGWFYTMHVLGTALFNRPAYTNVICHGWVVAADGQKLSKRLKNYTPINEVFDKYGADVLRFFMMSSPVVGGEDVRFSLEALNDVQRNIFMTWWNVYSFFTTYAEIDEWLPEAKLAEPKSQNVLDRWMLARLNQAIAEVTKHADSYEINRATRPLRELVDDVSNWYVRRSRRRFWKSQDDEDKQAAYATLHYVLVRMCQLMAPWAPFVADKMYRGLTDGMELPESVHLSDWPTEGSIDNKLLEEMALIRKLITGGLEMRARKGIRLRQPLSTAVLEWGKELNADLLEIAKEELNVKKVEFNKLSEDGSSGIRLDTGLTDDLKREGLARDLVRMIQNFRKEGGLEVDDRIELAVVSESVEVAQVAKVHGKMIADETLAPTVKAEALDDALSCQINLGEAEATIYLAKVSRQK